MIKADVEPELTKSRAVTDTPDTPKNGGIQEEVRPGSKSETAPRERARQRRRRIPFFILAILLSMIVVLKIAQMSSRRAAEPAPAVAAEQVRVWIDTRTGVYYCPHSEWYGKTKAGRYMTRREAHYEGFQPAYGKTCPVGEPSQ